MTTDIEAAKAIAKAASEAADEALARRDAALVASIAADTKATEVRLAWEEAVRKSNEAEDAYDVAAVEFAVAYAEDEEAWLAVHRLSGEEESK